MWRHIDRRRRVQFTGLLVLTLASSFAEVVSLSAVVPFISALTQPEEALAMPLVARAAAAIGVTSPAELLLPMAVGFALAALIAGILRLVVLWASIQLGNATGADLSVEVYRRTLYQPYSVHVSRNSSEIISGITLKVGITTSVLISVTAVITSAALLLAILLTLLSIEPVVATAALLSFGTGYGLIAFQTRSRLRRNSQCIADEQTTVVRVLQHGLGAIRDVLLDGTQDIYARGYGHAIHKLQQATGENAFINQAPRFAMETLGMVLVAILAYSISYQTANVGDALPVLGALGLGAQRLLPLLQQLYGNWAVIAGSEGAVRDVLGLLDQSLPREASEPEPAPLAFSRDIAFANVSFKYNPSGPWVLERVNLTITKGARVGFVGTTGSGKSTALDLLMALLEPTEGAIHVDGRVIGAASRRAWQRTLTHVPQTIFLADTTIAENIAFGVAADQIWCSASC